MFKESSFAIMKELSFDPHMKPRKKNTVIKSHKFYYIFRRGLSKNDTYLSNESKVELTFIFNKLRATVRDLEPTNDLTFLRIKSKLNEIMVAPDKDFILIVVQGPKEDKKEEVE